MMRYRDPAMSTYGEMDDIWDKLTNPNTDEFLTKADYEKIMLALENNLYAKGAGEHNANVPAFLNQDDQRIWTMAHARAQRAKGRPLQSRAVPAATIRVHKFHPLVLGLTFILI